MSTQSLNETRSANYRAMLQRREDAVAWADVRTLIRDCEEACEALLKHTTSSSKMDEMFMALEEAKGIAGAMQLENED